MTERVGRVNKLREKPSVEKKKHGVKNKQVTIFQTKNDPTYVPDNGRIRAAFKKYEEILEDKRQLRGGARKNHCKVKR